MRQPLSLGTACVDAAVGFAYFDVGFTLDDHTGCDGAENKKDVI